MYAPAIPDGTVARIHRSLPIFRLDEATRAILYAPGLALATSVTKAAAVEASLSGKPNGRDAPVSGLARRLEARGREVLRSWRELTTRPFEPECLTVYLSNQCNLACSYCYVAPRRLLRSRGRLRRDPEREPGAAATIVSEPLVYAAARLVARNCARKSRPLALVLQGGGEPTLHWSLLRRVRNAVARIAGEHGLPTWAYITTNGVLSEKRAAWLARHFNLVGLSCDGPPDVQDANRPTATGAPTSAIVERTARTLAAAGTEFHVRVTVTPATLGRQREIVEYCCDRLSARSVRLEPAYAGRHPSSSVFRPESAGAFVDCFFEARQAAAARGCELRVSGVRPDEIHGPYCNPLREVLQLTPDGMAAACLLTTGNAEREDPALAIGGLDPTTAAFVVDRGRVEDLRRRAGRIPPRCEACVNVYHCARDCPDSCVLTGDDDGDEHEGFRCRVQKLLACRFIREMAGEFSQVR